MANIIQATSIVTSGVIIFWAIATTVYGLYLSRRNNVHYNKRIVELLESIEKKLKGDQ